MKIGTFDQNHYGDISGKIYGLGFGVIPVIFEPATSKEGKPYLKVIAEPLGEAYEIGAAFPKQKDSMVFHSVSLEFPAFNAPLKAALFPDREREGSFNLVWDRPEQAKPWAEANVETGQTQGRRYIGASATITP